MFFVTTKQLQRMDFTLSDFYGYLLVLRENLKKYLNDFEQTSNLANCLQTELNYRLPVLIKNPLMLCVVFLDRRYSSELSKEEKELAIRSLIKLWEEIKSDRITNDKDIARNEDESVSFEFSNNASVLEEYFGSKGVELMTPDDSNNGEPNFNLSNSVMYTILSNFDEKVGRQIDFWGEHKRVLPEVYLLSNIINAVSPSQTSTERCFSSLNFIYDDRRTKLSLVLLEQILLIRLNKDLVSTVFIEDLESIKTKQK